MCFRQWINIQTNSIKGDKMEAYRLCSVYDILMNHIPYDKWADYIENILKNMA